MRWVSLFLILFTEAKWDKIDDQLPHSWGPELFSDQGCPAQLCPSMYYSWEESSCSCKMRIMCRRACSGTKGLHPYFPCKCVSRNVLDKIEKKRISAFSGKNVQEKPAECR